MNPVAHMNQNGLDNWNRVKSEKNPANRRPKQLHMEIIETRVAVIDFVTSGSSCTGDRVEITSARLFITNRPEPTAVNIITALSQKSRHISICIGE
mmetsp:Transcript_1744/g.6148  ORF Transcript_1744/g.6148 Transcript_1744/m.6148 type:complete len:96 (+) Transcript_1744:3437-3724(+)